MPDKSKKEDWDDYDYGNDDWVNDDASEEPSPAESYSDDSYHAIPTPAPASEMKAELPPSARPVPHPMYESEITKSHPSGNAIFTLGVLSVILACIPVLNMILAIIALVLATGAQKEIWDDKYTRDSMFLAGMILAVLGLILGLGFTSWTAWSLFGKFT